MWVKTLIEKKNRSATAVALAIVLLLSSALVAAASVNLLRISSDPYTNSGSQHKTEVEPDTLSAGSTIVSAFQVGRFFSGGASNVGFSTSTNGGKSFTQGFLPATTLFSSPAGTVYARLSDASVAFDARHNVWLISYLGLFPNGNTREVDVLASRSTDGGRTWGNPVTVNASGHFDDKNWSVCDNSASSPFYGHCYTEFDDNSLSDQIEMSTSTDGGATWGAEQATANHHHGIGGQPLVQPSGRVIVPIVGFAGNKFVMLSFISTDGGASWSSPVQISEVAFRAPAGGIRADIPLPSAEIDASGKVYVVWSDCRFEPGCAASDLVLTTSTDGVNWSSISRLPMDPIGGGIDHFIPGLAVDRSTSGSSAHLLVTFYFYPNANCTAATCQLNVGYSASANGGASWTTNTKLAGPMSLSWLPNTSQGVMVGDYISTSFSGGVAYPAFALATAPSGGLFNETTDTVQGGLSVPTGVNPVREQSKAGANDTLSSSSVTVQ